MQLSSDWICRRPNGWDQTIDGVPQVLEAVEVAFALHDLDLALEHVDRVPQDLVQRIHPSRLDQRVRIFAGRKRGDPDPHLVTQQLVSCPEGSLEPRLIAVIQEGGAGGVTLE